MYLSDLKILVIFKRLFEVRYVMYRALQCSELRLHINRLMTLSSCASFIIQISRSLCCQRVSVLVNKPLTSIQLNFQSKAK